MCSMSYDPNEVNVTNLGPQPEHLTFLEAARLWLNKRKYQINPSHYSKRMTLCETQREIWRIADTLPEPQRSDLQTLASCGFDAGKRMDARMKELRGIIECSQ